MFERIAIIGLGLIGSSIAWAVRKHGLAEHIVGFDVSDDVRVRARELGFADEVPDTAEEAAQGADLIVVAVPVLTTASVIEGITAHIKTGAIITDVGSVKEPVIRDVSDHVPDDAVFVPGHPIAGTEYSGPDAGFADLFEGRWWILTPCARSTDEAVEKLSRLFKAMGANIETMSADHHDQVLAITSHIPHLIAYNIVSTAADLEKVTRSEVIKFSASGFRDFTRIAASDPIMWRDIFLSNKDAVLEMLGRFSEDLAALQRAIRWDDGEALEDLFTRTRDIRRGIIEAGQETAEPDFGRHRSGGSDESK